ncbi:MAG: trypsin-like peptidase domain-containing protein [Candidatus Uhrbacteria bacterium]
MNHDTRETIQPRIYSKITWVFGLVLVIAVGVSLQGLFSDTSAAHAEIATIDQPKAHMVDRSQASDFTVFEDVFSIIKASEQATSSVSTTTSSILEYSPYLDGVGAVMCEGDSFSSIGSGSLVGDASSPKVLTNLHVIRGVSSCVFYVASESDPSVFGLYSLDLKYTQKNSIADEAYLSITKQIGGNLPIERLNVRLGTLPSCASNIPTGSRVVVIGFPKYSNMNIQMDSGISKVIPQRQITEGIITGKDASPMQDGLPSPNYFVSTKMDTGSSGGIALSTDAQGICSLGIPTWIQEGEYASQGIVQSMKNIVHSRQE